MGLPLETNPTRSPLPPPRLSTSLVVVLDPDQLQWAIDEVFARPMINVHVPDTIIIQKGKPSSWFYSDDKVGRCRLTVFV